MYTDIDSLIHDAGMHPVYFGEYHRLFAARFLFAVYYKVLQDTVLVYAVLDCRGCIAHCGVLAEVVDDHGRRKVTKVTGDPDNPLFKGYTCPKGRALPELHNHEGRLLHTMKRQPDGRHSQIASEQAAMEVAVRWRFMSVRPMPVSRRRRV